MTRSPSRAARGPVLAGLLLAALTSGACAGSSALKNDAFTDGTVDYEVTGPGEGWREIRVENANVAWLHEATAATLMVNSHCEGVEDADLHVLTRHLTIGMEDRQVLEEKVLNTSRREALQTTLTASLDGVPRKLRTLVLKKDGCVYDVVVAANPEKWDVAAAGFERVIAGFDVKPRADRS